jgi:peroxiredoxin (alkyl hydroperoxide reductase subunit C)
LHFGGKGNGKGSRRDARPSACPPAPPSPPNQQQQPSSIVVLSHAHLLPLHILNPPPYHNAPPSQHQIRELDELADEFATVKTSVAAISVDSAFSHHAWNAAPRENGGLGGVSIPLIADVTKQISRDYGVLVDDPADELAGVSLRAAFIIDPKRRVRSVQVNDENAGRSMQELLRLVKAFQHADAHGEGCPASWQPGKDTIVPTPEGSRAFFLKWAGSKGEL